jgi:dipeptidyl aminopeptidase/acylaminoacyl peptidase
MRSIACVSFVSLSALVALLASCSGKPQPPPCNASASAWTPSAIATPYASNATSASVSASVAPPPPVAKSPYTLEQLLSVKRALSPAALDAHDFLYLYDESGTAQVWSHHADEDRALTKLPDRVGFVRPAPDGSRAVFLVDHGGDENFQIDLLGVAAPNEGAILPLTASPKVKHTLPSFDDKGDRIAYTANARNGKDMDLFVATLPKVGTDAKPNEKEKPLVELSGSWSVSDFRGDKVLLQEERSSFDQDLWIVDAKSKQKRLLTKHTGEERWFDAHMSRDGKVVFALSDAGREFVGVTMIDVATAKQTALVAIDHDVDRLAVPRWTTPRPKKGAAPAPDETVAQTEDVLVYAVNVDGGHHLDVLHVDDKRKAAPPTDIAFAMLGPTTSVVISAIDVSGDGRAAFAVVESATNPPEVFRLDLTNNTLLHRDTSSDHAGVDTASLVAATLEHFKTFDDRSISYFLYAKKSENPSSKSPCVIVVHGGPEAQAQPNFSALVQYLALSGYDVALPNVRGSTGYGKSFSHLDDKEKRLDAVKDLSELGKALAARPDVDGARLALFGGSYGGFMVLAGLAFYPKQWAAGIDIVGIANFKTFLEQTAPYRRALREAEYGSLEKDAAMLDAISPIHKVDQIVAPLMVIHGTNDPRVPVGEAKQIAEALKKKGVPVELMLFDDEGHGLAKLKNRLVAYPAAVKFLDDHVAK